MLTYYVVRRRGVTRETPPTQDVDSDEPELYLGSDGETVHPVLLLLAVLPGPHSPPPSILLYLDMTGYYFRY